MHKIWNITSSPYFLKYLSIIALFIYTFLVILNTPNEFIFHYNDNYNGSFLRFLELGYYDAVSEGTPILYNVALSY